MVFSMKTMVKTRENRGKLGLKIVVRESCKDMYVWERGNVNSVNI